MAEMSTALRAVDLHAGHAIGAVGRRANRSFNRLEKARPTGAALELRIAREERLPTAGACEGAGTLLEVERAGACALSAMLAQDVKLLGCQRLLPVRIG